MARKRGRTNSNKMGFPVVGVASTIDNDLVGSEITIGVDTALNIALEAIDRLKVTASSHRRAFLVEVMGRDCGYLALMAGIAGGAEAIVIPEVETKPEVVIEILHRAYERGKKHGMVVVAEGATYNADALSAVFYCNTPRMSASIIARQFSVTCSAAALPARLTACWRHGWARKRRGSCVAEMQGVLIGWLNDSATPSPYEEIVGKHKPLDLRLFELADVLAQ